jgi:hypothetical protein
MEQSKNSVIFSARGDSFFSAGDDHFAEMQRRLTDPKERAALRASMRADLDKQHPTIAEDLGIDAALAAKFLDLLADQQIANQARFFEQHQSGAKREPGALMTNMVAGESRDKDQIRQLIGEEAFDRYLRYDETSMERQQVTQFSARLDAADRLSADQRQKLMALTRERMYKRFEMRPPGSLDSPIGRRLLTMSAEERDAFMLKQNIELNEESVRELHQEKQSMVEQARVFLTPKQLESYSKWYDDRIETSRKYVEKMRVSAGMSPTFDDLRPPVPRDEPARFEGRVRLQMHVKVDSNEPVTIDVTTENGKAPEPFEIAPGLWAEPTPVLYANGNGNVMVKYYEDRRGKRQPLRGMQGIGIVASRYQSTLPLGSGGGGGGIVSGSKPFGVFTDARLTVAP